MARSDGLTGSDVARGTQYAVLGPLEVVIDGGLVALGGPKQRTVVAALIAAAGHPVSVDLLLQAVYGEDASSTYKASLQTFMSNLRHILGDVIVRRGDGYLLECGAAAIDAAQFDDAVRLASTEDDPHRVAASLRTALGAWRGHPYADIEAHGFLDGEITRLSELRLVALETRIDADMRAGHHREVVAELDALTTEHPFRENLRAMHMLALYRSGRQAEALRAFGRTRVALLEGLGIDPSAELQELERHILEQDPGLIVAVGPKVLRRAVVVVDIDDDGWLDPAQREHAFTRREVELTKAVERDDGVMLAPRGTAGYAIFKEPIQAVRAARALVDGRTRVALDWGDLEFGDDDPFGPPVTRAARLVAVAHPGQVLLSASFHAALTAAGEAGWGAKSLGSFDIVGLEPGAQLHQLTGDGAREQFPDLLIDRLPTAVPSGGDRSVPGYELRALIGAGELGEVHRAYQPSVGREVAVRIFGPGMVGHPQFVRRFETASQRITRVEHPNVLPLLDYWRQPNRAVMVNRLVSGGSLADRIPPGGLGAADAMTLFETVAAAVASAHRHGVVHGRIRPENVLFDAEGNAYIADLGVDEICTGVISFATTGYDAPERLGGILATPASDIYSLAILLHEMESGSPPPPDGALQFGPAALGEVLRRATDPDPAARQHSVDELVAEVRTALAVPAQASAMFVVTRNPYRGLKPFEQADAEDFFGRDRAVQEMLDVLELSRLLLVVGPSGIGKSSAVKAGLVPALGRGAIAGSDSWLFTEMVPGDSPFEQLSYALARVATTPMSDVVGDLTSGRHTLAGTVRRHILPASELLIVVDQFEELFTQAVDDADRRAFLQMLVGVVDERESCVRVVLTLRADHFDRPLAYPGFSGAVHGRTVALGAMSAGELAEAVRRPADAVGVTIESSLVERISADAELQPGSLPLVQHVLAELFEQRRTNSITVVDYEGAGGLTGAIGREAEAIYLSFAHAGRDATRHLFIRLVSVSEDREDTRRRVRRTELEQAGIATDDLDDVLVEYGRHRLITFDRDPSSRAPTVEVAHEALLKEWPRFAEWVDEARDDLLTRKRVESATRDWVHSGGDDGFLLRGGRLELLESWAASSAFGLTHDEQSFLATSRDKVDRERAGRRRRRRRVVGLLVAALVVTATLGAVAVRQRNAADRETRETRARELAGQAQLAIEEDPERAIMLALAAADTTDEPLPEAVSALQMATQAMRLRFAVDGVGESSVEYHPDGSMVVVDRGFGTTGAVLIDASSGEVLTYLNTDHPPGIAGFAFGREGKELAVAYGGAHDAEQDKVLPHEGDPAVERFAIPGGESLGTLSGPPGQYQWLLHDRDERWLGAVRRDNDGPGAEIMAWTVDSPDAPISLGRGMAFDFVPGTSTAVVLGEDGHGPLRVVDVPTGEVVREIELPDIAFVGLAIDPRARLVALMSFTARQVIVLDVQTGAQITALTTPTPTSFKFSSDGRWLAVGGNDNLVRMFETDGFAETLLAGSPEGVANLAFAPDGSRLASIGAGQLRSWELSPAGHPALRNIHTSKGLTGSFVVSEGESAALILSAGTGTVALERVDLATGMATEIVGAVDELANVPGFGMALSEDLRVVAGLDDEYRGHVIDLVAGSDLGLERCETVRGLDRSGQFALIDGRRLCENVIGDPPLLPGPGTSSRVVDLHTGRTILDLADQAVWNGDFGPLAGDGLPDVVAVEDVGGTITVYDLPNGEVIGSYTTDGFALFIALSPDGRRLALSNSNGNLTVIDVSTLADPAGPEEWTVVAHNGSVQGLSLSDSGLIATASSAGNARVWSAVGTMLADFPLHLDDPPRVEFVPGIDTLYYEDGDGVIRRFPGSLGELTRLARSMLTRALTPNECARYFPDERCPTFDG